MARTDRTIVELEPSTPASPSADPGPVEVTERATPAWVISGVAHVTILLVFSMIVLISRSGDVEYPVPYQVQIDRPKEPIKPPPGEPTREPSESLVNHLIEAPKEAPITQVEVPAEEFTRTETDIEAEKPLGREEAKGDMEFGGTGLAIAIGAGSGSNGVLGSRRGGGKHRARALYCGGPRGIVRDSAIDAALRWFKKHQSPNGQWDVDAYQVNCTEAPKCEPGSEYTDEAGDVACTGYALLCYLGAGYDHRMASKYRPTVKRAVDWLVAAQKADGLWGQRNYEHAVATMALAEAYAMSNDPALKAPAQKAVDLILKRQTPESAGGYGLGWDYVNPNPARMDSSVSGWNVMALKSAAAAGLSVQNGMEGAAHWLRKTWEATNPEWKKLDPYGTSRFPYTWSVDNKIDIGAVGTHHKDLACVGLVCATFLYGKLPDAGVMIGTLANYNLQHHLPKSYPCNTYYLYYNTMGMFQAGGAAWEKWNAATGPLLTGSQRKSNDCFAGSWDSEGTLFPGSKTGRLLSTAYNCLSLEVIYRYLPLNMRAK